jgi:hypothetical protein
MSLDILGSKVTIHHAPRKSASFLVELHLASLQVIKWQGSLF